MIEIKIGILLDACGIAYTTKQLSKLEALINTCFQTQISKHVQKNDTDFNDSVSDPIAIKEEENALDDTEQAVKEIKTEETVFKEDTDNYEHNYALVSKDPISDDILKESVTEIKTEDDENGSEPMHEVTEDNHLVCSECKSTFGYEYKFGSKLQVELHYKMTHDCELSLDERKQFKWTCPCCSEKFPEKRMDIHIRSCEIFYDKMNAGCLECGKKFNYKNPKKGCSMLSEHMSKEHKKECQKCEESFESHEKFKDHREMVHKEEYCSFCRIYFPPEYLANHDKDKHICEICQERVYSKWHHKNLKHNEKRYCCKYCDKTFSNNTLLQTHILKAHIKPLSCDVCDYTCGTQAQLDNHNNSHVNMSYSCEECNLTFKSNYRKKIHVLEIHEKKFDYECSKCEKMFCLEGQLRHHMKVKHNFTARKGKEQQTFCCEYCVKQFNNLSTMNVHINNVHLKIKKFPCTHCDKAFQANNRLREHLKMEHSDGIKKFQCDDCGKCYLTSEKLKFHKKHMHGPKNFKCDNCSKYYVSQGDLNAHMKLSHGQQDENCPHCNKSFTVENRLLDHIKRVHTKPHRCNQCDKGYGSTYLLEVHIQSAHKEKSKKCTLCSDMFSTSELLKNHHSHAHDMSKPFHCSICSKTFNSKELLEHHVARAHEMRNCELCPHCNKQFSRLKAHLLTCSVKWSGKEKERKRYECPDCDKTYLDKKALNIHIKKSCKTTV